MAIESWGVTEGPKAELSPRCCCRDSLIPAPKLCHVCLPQGSQGCQQPVPRGLVPRGQGSLEQERRWKQYLEDERIALFLQNEEFMKELQRNRDFLLALERGEKKLLKLLLLGRVPCCDPGCWQHCPARGIRACAKAEPILDVARLGAGGLSCPHSWAAPWTPALLPLPAPLQHLWQSPAESTTRSFGNAL